MDESLYRMGKHLPGRRLLGTMPPEDRLDIDASGSVWVTEDPLLVILKGHLLIEAALVDICARHLNNPAALEKENIRFPIRLSLVCALLEPDYFPESIVSAMRDLNHLRNSLAHNLEPTDLNKALEKFFARFDEFEDFHTPHENDKNIASRLSGCIAFLCGALGNIEKSEDQSTP